nr:phage tail tape measure protein [Halomarina salina]
MDRAGSRADDLRSAFLGVGAVTAGLTVGLGLIARQGANIDETFQTVQSVTGATSSELSAMRDTTQELAATTTQSAGQIAQGFKYLAYSGLDAKESIAAIDEVAELATVSQMSLADATRSVTSTLSSFGLEASKAGDVASTMSSVFASSDVELSELSETLSYVSSQANTASQDLATTAGAAGILSDAGIRSSRAGTTLRGILASLSDPSGKAAEALKTLGLSISDFSDQEGDLLSLDTVFQKLQSRMKDMGSQQRTRILQQLFGREAASGAAVLVNRVGDLSEKINQVSAANLQSAIDALREAEASALDQRTTDLGVSLSPDMNREEVLSQFQQLSEEVDQEELQQQIKVGLNVGDGAAEYLAGELEAGTSVDSLASSMESAVTAGELASDKLSTVNGRLRYLAGSAQSAAYSMYAGFRPALSIILDGLVAFADVVTAVPGALKVFGAAMFATAAAGVALTASLGMTIARSRLQAALAADSASATWAQAMAQRGAAAASRAAAGAQAVYTAALQGNLLALTRQKGAQAAATLATWRSTAAERASAAATWASTAATNARTIASNGAAAAQNLYAAATNRLSLALARQKVAAAASAAATYATTGASYAAAAASSVLSTVMGVGVTGAFYAAAAAAVSFMVALGPIGWVALAAGALLVGAAVSDLGGTIDAVLGPVSALVGLGGDLLGWTLDLAGAVLDLAGALAGLGLGVVLAPFEAFYNLVNALTGGGIDEAAASVGGLAESAAALLAPLVELPGTIRGVADSIRGFDPGEFLSSLPGQAASAAADVPGAIAGALGGFSWTVFFPPLALTEFVTGVDLGDYVEWPGWDAIVPEFSWPSIPSLKLGEQATASVGLDIGNWSLPSLSLPALDIGNPLAGVESAVSDSVAGVQASLTGLWSAFEQRFPRTAEALATRAEDVGNVVQWVGDQFDAAGDTVARTLRPLEGWADTAGDVARTAGMLTLGPLVLGLRAAGDAAGWAGEQFDRLVGSPIGGFVDGVESGVQDVRTSLRNAIPSTGEVLGGLGDLGGAVASQLGTGLDVTLASILTPETMLPKVGQWWYDAGAGLVDALVNGVTSAPDAVAGAVEGVVDDVASYLPGSDAERGPLSNLTARGQALPETMASGAQRGEGSLASTLASVLSTAMPSMGALDVGPLAAQPNGVNGALSGVGQMAGLFPGVQVATPTVNAPDPPSVNADVDGGQFPSGPELARQIAQANAREGALGDSSVTVSAPTIERSASREEMRQLLREEGLSKKQVEQIITAAFRDGDAGPKPGRRSG